MARASVYAALPTEQSNPRSRMLDRLTPRQLLRAMNREDALVPRAVGRVLPQISRAVQQLIRTMQRGGRIMFIGAGTSGRLGVIEAAECPPTFNTPTGLVQTVMAGGRAAVFRSREGAEDDGPAAARVVRRRVRAADAVVGIAASGVTPFVASALRAARAQGAATILVTCNPAMAARRMADVVIAPRVGPELIAGSTRLKAGTATKLVLNMLTLGTMVQLGKTYGHWMVDVRPASRKLLARALSLVARLAPCSLRTAREALYGSRGSVKAAVLIARDGLTAAQARHRLAETDGSLRLALQSGVRPRAATSSRFKRGV